MRIELLKQSEQHLVLAERVHNMAVYVITNGDKFIKQNVGGDYTGTTNLTLAETYKSRKLAQSVLNNALSYSMRNTYYVAEFTNNNLIPCGEPRCDRLERRKDVQAYHCDNSIDEMSWCKKFSGLENVFEDAISRGYELSQELGEVDAKISDLRHYIEFYPLNARDGFKIYRKLRELLCQRRQLKNEQRIVSAINDNHSAGKQISNIVSVINECKNREYKPRIFVDLFENGIKSLEVQE